MIIGATKQPLSLAQYFAAEHPKTQIYLHHTAGNANPKGVVKGWEANEEHVATAFVIGGDPKKNTTWKDGEVVQCFDEKHWSYHLGLQTITFSKRGIPYQSLDKISIGIEVCNWGYLTKTDRGFTTYVNTTVPDNEVVEYTGLFKKKRYYHKYTNAQIDAVGKLLKALRDEYKIPLTYNEDVWDICLRALKGEAGVFTHNSVRTDKSDVHPQKELIDMWKGL